MTIPPPFGSGNVNRMNRPAMQLSTAEFFIVDGKMLSFTGIVPHGHSMADVDRFLASIDIED